MFRLWTLWSFEDGVEVKTISASDQSSIIRHNLCGSWEMNFQGLFYEKLKIKARLQVDILELVVGKMLEHRDLKNTLILLSWIHSDSEGDRVVFYHDFLGMLSDVWVNYKIPNTWVTNSSLAGASRCQIWALSLLFTSQSASSGCWPRRNLLNYP